MPTSAATTCCLPLQTTGSATSVRGFGSSIPCPSLPLSTLRNRTFLKKFGAFRKTRGQDGSLLLSCRTLSFLIACRFIPALRLSHLAPSLHSEFAARLCLEAQALTVVRS